MENTVKAGSDSPVSSSAVYHKVQELNDQIIKAISDKQPKDILVNLKFEKDSDGKYVLKAEKTFDEIKSLIGSGHSVDFGGNCVALFKQATLLGDNADSIFSSILFPKTILSVARIDLVLNSDNTIHIVVYSSNNILTKVSTPFSINSDYLLTPDMMFLITQYILLSLANSDVNNIDRSNFEFILDDQKIMITTTDDVKVDWSGADIVWSDGTAPTLEANKKYLFTFSSDNTTEKLYCTNMKTYNN